MKLAVTAAFALVLATPAFALAQGGPGPGATPEQMQKIVMAMDVDKDGRVSKAEGENMPPGAFEAMDANHDGFLVPEETNNPPPPKGPPPQK